MSANTATSAFLLANGLYFEACSLYFRNMLTDMNVLKSKRATNSARLELNRSLINAIHFHNEAKRYGLQIRIDIIV